LLVESVQAWVLSPEDLILAKLEWARMGRSDRQISDVRSLLDGVPDLDHAYLHRSASSLGLKDMLEKARE
jgi:hypothetical protein